MKTIVITGPSGSGKSYLSNRLSKLFYDSILIKTDSYYRDNLLIRFLSIFLYDIYDRPISIKKYKIHNILRSIVNKDKIISIYKYDFKRKHSSQSKIGMNYQGDNQFIILEGIFAHRLNLNYNNTINIVCEAKKETCFKRRLKRDQIERARNTREVNKKFNKSWSLFYGNVQNFLNKNKFIAVNPVDKISYDKLIFNLKSLQKN
ncbi:uridine kinase [Prochlorococcus sp. MIT 0916]|uniref:uridine kinase family protein n=1 Tax=Prochlorococcus sp. MIT 0916 TaxID=3082521 RepID=UPI0039B6CE75